MFLCTARNALSAQQRVAVQVRYATEHRCGAALHCAGGGLSDAVTDTDPLRDGLPLLRCQARDASPEVRRRSCDCLRVISLSKGVLAQAACGKHAAMPVQCCWAPEARAAMPCGLNIGTAASPVCRHTTPTSNSLCRQTTLHE